MPSTDWKLELKAKTSVTQTSQAAAYAKGLYSPYVLFQHIWIVWLETSDFYTLLCFLDFVSSVHFREVRSDMKHSYNHGCNYVVSGFIVLSG
jgi:hypothetical protein